MTLFDSLIIIVLLVRLVRSVWIGFVRELASIAGLVLGFLVAGAFHSQVSEFLIPLLGAPLPVFILSYALLFGVTYLGVALAGLILKKVMSITLLGWFDRAMGAVFGLLKGAFICSLLFMGATTVLSSSNPYLRRSLSYPYLAFSTRILTFLIADRQLLSKIMPQGPAIDEQALLAVPPRDTILPATNPPAAPVTGEPAP